MIIYQSEYPLEYLQNLPTLCIAQADNLKIEGIDQFGRNMRVWLCRCGIADGMPYDNMVTVETLYCGRWETLRQYQAQSARQNFSA